MHDYARQATTIREHLAAQARTLYEQSESVVVDFDQVEAQIPRSLKRAYTRKTNKPDLAKERHCFCERIDPARGKP